jgi:signal transduction histidine kinase
MVFIVADNGIGMNEEGIRIALEPFGQVDEAMNGKYEGTGLGLPLTKQLVETHDGRLDVEIELGIGTIVTVEFPNERVLQ